MADYPRTTARFNEIVARAGGGASLVAYRYGTLELELHSGNTASGQPWRDGTLVQCQSATKGVMATLVHILAGKGLLDLDAPVAEYWPEFSHADKADVRVRHVLSHSAGLHKLRRRTASIDEIFDYDLQVQALASQEPAYPPGTRNGYHALTYGWLTGELVRRVTGQTIQSAITDQLAAPLDVDGLYLGCPQEKRHRVAPCRFRRGPLPSTTLPRGSKQLTSDPRSMDNPVPAIGGFFTARSLAAMYGMLLGGGEWNGRRLLEPAGVLQATRIQSERRDLVLRLPMMWRLGFHGMRARPGGLVPDAFGHVGFGGSAGWADPRHGLSVGFTRDSNRSAFDQPVARLIAAIHADLTSEHKPESAGAARRQGMSA